MQSLIIITEKTQGLIHVAQVSSQFPQTNPLDQLVLEPEPSVGIDAIRSAQSFLITPPIKGLLKRVVVVDAHTMTTEAQNSMLKVLEEPPAYAQIVLLTLSLDSLLPTVQSRCQILSLPIQIGELNAQTSALVTQLEGSSVSEKIAFAQSFAKSKQAAKEVIEQLLQTQQTELDITRSPKQVNRIEALFEALVKVQANSNNRLVLEQLFFSW